MDYFTSDLHLFHKRMVELRGFSSVDAMNEALIGAWNARVTSFDRVFVLGDFSFGDLPATTGISSRLRGQKFLVKGNHDSLKDCLKNPYFGWVKDAKFTKAPCGTYLSMSHYPMLVWDRAHHGSWHLHGHSHGNLRLPAEMTQARIFDVGVDNVYKYTGRYEPVTFEEIKEMRGEVGHAKVDHH